MTRREFITLLGGAAVSWPLAAGAQQSAMPVIGFLSSRAPEDSTVLLAAFRRGLAERGYSEGQNVTVEYRWARGQYGQLPALAVELVDRNVSLIVTAGGDPSALAAKAATSSIPIVFNVGIDPVELGLVANFARPGGNATGMQIFTTSLEPKRLGLLDELLPPNATVGVLFNPNYPSSQKQSQAVQEAARALNLSVRIFWVGTDPEIESAFDPILQQGITALMLTADPFFDTRRDKFLGWIASHKIPAMFQFRAYTAAGGLMSYGIDLPDVYRQEGIYTARILNGEKPAELPVMQPTKFEFIINLKTAKAFGLAIPPTLLALADEVIE